MLANGPKNRHFRFIGDPRPVRNYIAASVSAHAKLAEATIGWIRSQYKELSALKENKRKKNKSAQEPEAAPGMIIDNPLEENAAEEEIAKGEYTPVTRLFIDRTPED
jgi:hypothetical protein